MAIPQKKDDGHYTYVDYCTWDDDFRCELIDGVVYAMTSPSPIHQDIILALALIIGSHLKGKPCKLYFAPSDVRLNADSADDTVVQPDLYVICDRSKFVKNAYVGVPELVIEVTSPSTAHKDKSRKFQKYLQAKVPEYWIVEPDSKIIIVNLLESDRYVSRFYHNGEKLITPVLAGCVIDLAEVFSSVEDFEKQEEQ